MNSALRLYEIAGQLHSLEGLTESDDLPAEAIAGTIEGLEGDFDTKAVQIAKLVLSLEANAKAIAQAAEAMQTRGLRVLKRAESIKSYLQFHMQALQKRRIETPELVIGLKANPPAVHIVDEREIPDGYWVEPEPMTPPRRLDKVAIAKDLKAGKEVRGAYLEAGEKLEIKL